MSPIPIKNVYYLLLYAWDQYTPKGQIEVGAEASPDLPNLLGRVLVEGDPPAHSTWPGPRLCYAH
jgi:hypothetical protein